MKLNLLLNGNDIRSGFTNVDPFAAPGDGKTLHSVTNLDGLVEDAEASEVVALNVIDFVQSGLVDDVLTHWARKLAHGGTLTVGGLDLSEAARRLHNGDLNIREANGLVYGVQDAPWNYRKASLSGRLLEEKFRVLGLTIAAKNFDHDACGYAVTGRRP